MLSLLAALIRLVGLLLFISGIRGTVSPLFLMDWSLYTASSISIQLGFYLPELILGGIFLLTPYRCAKLLCQPTLSRGTDFDASEKDLWIALRTACRLVGLLIILSSKPILFIEMVVLNVESISDAADYMSQYWAIETLGQLLVGLTLLLLPAKSGRILLKDIK